MVVSDYAKAIYVHCEEPERKSTTVMTFFKSDKTPWEMRNTVEGYMSEALIQTVLVKMIQDRLDEYSTDPECPYAAAQVMVSDFLVAATKDAFAVYVVPTGDILSAYNAAMGIIARACKTGFTQSELERATSVLLNGYEKSFNEKDKTYNSSYGQELIRHFIENEPMPGIEAELQLAKQILPMVPVEAYNQIAQQILTSENQVIVISQPLNDNTNVLQEAEVIAALEATLGAQYEAYVDEVITEPLIEKLPAPGSIKATKSNPEMGTTEFTLSNGVKVILKTTDFKADEIRVEAFRKGGKQQYSKDQAADVLVMDMAVELSKLGNFDINMMKKYLAGKTVSLGYSTNSYTDVLEGFSSVKDFDRLMEVIYAYFTELNPDEKTYQAQIDQIKPILANQDQLPDMIFARQRAKTTYGDNPLMGVTDLAVFEKANYSNMLSMAKKNLSNAADFTFIFVGNIDEDTLRPMLEKYIATLPSKGVPSEYKVVTDIDPVKGLVENKFDVAMQTPSTTVFNMYSGTNLNWDVKNSIMVDLMGDVLDMIFIETLREDEGGTYGASVSGMYNFSNNTWQLMYAYQTAEDKLERMEARADKELENLLKNGSKADHFNKVKEAAIKQYEIGVKTNSYWEGALMSAERGYNTHAGYIEALQSLTHEEFNKFLKNVYDGKNLIEVIMVGKEAAK